MSKPDSHRLPLMLSIAGLIPFVSLAGFVIFTRTGETAELAAAFLLLYALAILSFLGGIRWGAALKTEPIDQTSLALSVVPSLAAWLAPTAILLTDDLRVTLFIFAGLFAVQFIWDRLAWQSGKLPAWFSRSRQIATAGAMASLISAALFLIERAPVS